MSFYDFMKKFENEKNHFGDLFEDMKDINFPRDIFRPKDIIDICRQWHEELSTRDTIYQALNHYQSYIKKLNNDEK
ncbi:YozE family protein [Staphylococcus hominis]|uniref:YozE family protein n=1 Tax=Staphylococcus hominis TaxID=1290 RepID=UPI0011A009DC|nr:YozE family protein [Staphylococcus hominis]